MSGTGAAVAPRMQHAELKMRGFDPTHGCQPAVEAERAAVIEHVRRKIDAVKVKTGWTIPVEEAGHLVRVLDELAEDLSRGLHTADLPGAGHEVGEASGLHGGEPELHVKDQQS